MHRTRRSAVVVATLAAALALSPASLAQNRGGGGGGGGGAFGNVANIPGPMSENDVAAVAALLELTPDQVELLEAIRLDVEVEFEQARGQFTAYLEQVRDAIRGGNRDPEMFAEIREVRDEFQASVGDMRDRLYADLQLMLDEEQIQAWPKVERRDRRRSNLRGLPVTGAGLDVIALHNAAVASIEDPEAETVADAEPPAAAGILDQYETELDRLLRKVEDIRADQQDAENQEERVEAVLELREAAVEVRDLNRRFAERVLAVIPPDAAPTFEDRYWSQALPRQAGGSPGRVFDRLARLPDLSEEQITDLEAMKADFATRLRPLNKAVLDEWYAWDESRDIQQQQGQRRRGGRNQQQQVPDDVRQAIEARAEILQRLRADLEGVLTPEQIESVLPERRTNQGRPERPVF